MSDLSWAAALTELGGGGSSGGGGTGVSDYNQLTNRPVINLTGESIVVSQLETGVYNIDGTWKVIESDEVRKSENDDLFYVLNNGSTLMLTWICAGQIKKVTAPINGSAEDIVIEDIATIKDVFDQLVGEF